MINGLFGRKKGTGGKKKRAGETFTIDVPGIGEVRIVRSARARRINLTVKTDGTVRLTIPYGIPEREGLRFLESKKEWIIKTRAKYPKEAQRPVLPPYSTRSHTLRLVPLRTATDAKIQVRVTETEVTVKYSDHLDPSDAPVQEAIKKGIERAWRDEAKRYLPGRLDELSRVMGLQYRSVTIRNTVSKWGSCSVRNDISLSLHLMRLPDHLIDYILLHELCHSVHKNHGPGFHALLDKVTDNRHAALRREMKSYHTRW